ncbi:MAG: transposase [Nitrosopumilaceae archaeon]|nr:transposase [Nitrosopumilaceae archaeon]
MINRYRGHPALGKCMEKLGRALPDMFRFVLDPRIAQDNNAAERQLRELVVHRKVRGSIRSADTMDWMGALFTCVGTWKGRGLDYTEELARYA